MLFSLINISGGFSENPPPSGEKLPFGRPHETRPPQFFRAIPPALSPPPPPGFAGLSTLSMSSSSPQDALCLSLSPVVTSRASLFYLSHYCTCSHTSACMRAASVEMSPPVGACRESLQRPKASQAMLPFSLSLFRILHAESRLFSSVKPANERI